MQPAAETTADALYDNYSKARENTLAALRRVKAAKGHEAVKAAIKAWGEATQLQSAARKAYRQAA